MFVCIPQALLPFFIQQTISRVGGRRWLAQCAKREKTTNNVPFAVDSFLSASIGLHADARCGRMASIYWWAFLPFAVDSFLSATLPSFISRQN